MCQASKLAYDLNELSLGRGTGLNLTTINTIHSVTILESVEHWLCSACSLPLINYPRVKQGSPGIPGAVYRKWVYSEDCLCVKHV